MTHIDRSPRGSHRVTRFGRADRQFLGSVLWVMPPAP